MVPVHKEDAVKLKQSLSREVQRLRRKDKERIVNSLLAHFVFRENTNPINGKSFRRISEIY